MILGFDVSTSITGITIVDDCGKIVHSEYWDLRKYKDFFDKSFEANVRVSDLYHHFGKHLGNKDGVATLAIAIKFLFLSYMPIFEI